MTSRVLIVEDDAGIREAIAAVLADAGIPSSQVANGLEALELLGRDASPPDLILLDIMMPVMDGWTFRAKQREDPRLASIPVVIFTAHASARDVAEKMGAAAFLKKPVDLEALLATVRRLGGGAATA